MSGLLDKANKVAGDEKYQDSVHQGNNIVNDPDAIISAYERGKMSNSESPEKVVKEKKQEPQILVEDDFEDPPVDKRILIGLQITGAVALLISLFLLIQNGYLYATFLDYLIAISLMILGWILYNGSDYLSEELSKMKMGVTAVVFAGLFITTVVGTMFMNAGGGVTIASVKLDGDNNEIDLSFYGPSGMDYTIDVLVDGEIVYSKDLEINIDRGSHSIDLEDVWDGNSMDMNDRILVNYEVIVTSEGGEDSADVGDLMTREVDTAYVRITEVFSTDNEDKTYTGINVEMIVGIGDPDADYEFSNDYFTGTPPKTVASDWKATLKVKKGSSTVYQYQPVYSDEGLGYLGSSDGTFLGEFWAAWVAMPGTDAGNLARDDFYDGDGCYTFEVQIENELGDVKTDTSSGIEFFWDSNEAGGNDPASSANC